jgi:hypothetical protein
MRRIQQLLFCYTQAMSRFQFAMIIAEVSGFLQVFNEVNTCNESPLQADNEPFSACNEPLQLYNN